MDWLSPYEMNGLSELRKRLGYEKGGQTIDWLLSMTPNRISRLTQDLGFQNGGQTMDWILPEETNRLIEVTRELGFTEIGQTMECLLGMATCRPLFKLTNSLGIQDCRKTIEWLLNEAQQNIAAIEWFSTHYSSPINIPPQFPLNQVGDTVSSLNPGVVIYNNRPPTEPLNLADLKPSQRLMHRSFGNHGVLDRMMYGNPQQNEFHTNRRGLQGGPRHAENKFSNSMVGGSIYAAIKTGSKQTRAGIKQ